MAGGCPRVVNESCGLDDLEVSFLTSHSITLNKQVPLSKMGFTSKWMPREGNLPPFLKMQDPGAFWTK